jgi:copper chaperone CopZ
VRDFDLAHEKRMHLIVMRRDGRGFQHLHPAMDAEAELRFTVMREGRVIHTEPYLGAGGHLVALREGDLAFLHVHPPGHAEEGVHDDAVGFATESPAPAATACTSSSTRGPRAHRRAHPGGGAMTRGADDRRPGDGARTRRGADGRPDGGATTRLELPITGMTCASCANRFERRLNKLDGVSASVNYATEKATVEFDPAAIRSEQLVAAVEAAGHRATLPQAEEPAERQPDEAAPLRRRLVLAALLSLPVLAMAMIPALQFDNFQWLSLNLVTPVVLWAGWPFHRAAWANLRHGTATIDTLISVGTLAAWGWSLYALFLGDAGMNDMRMGFDLWAGGTNSERADQIYLETAGVVTTFLLAGRYFEARARRRAGAALKALLELGAKDVALLDERGAERRVAVGELKVGDRFVVRPGEKLATDGVVDEGRSALDMAMLTGEPVPVEVEPGAEVAGGTVTPGPARRSRHARGRRHGARADRPPRRGGADRQGPGPAARRPHLRRVRPRRHRPRGGHARLLARHGG